MTFDGGNRWTCRPTRLRTGQLRDRPGREDPAQVRGEVPCGGVAILLPLRQRLEARPSQLGRDVADELPGRLRLVVTHLPQEFLAIGRPEGQAPGEHFVKHHAQAVDVGAAVDAVGRAGRLLRRHVVRSAGDDALLSAARLGLAEGQAEVHEHRCAVGAEEDVRRLDVAVDDESGVRVGERVGHGGRDPGGLRPGRAVVAQPPAEVGAVEVIGDDVDLPLVHAHVVDRHDAGVAQLGEPPRLLQGRFAGLRRAALACSTLMATGRSSCVSCPR